MIPGRVAALFAAIAVVLSVVAWSAPAPAFSDRLTYEMTAARRIVPDCADLHCSRVLVPWVLGLMPGSSIAKWRAYAALANLLAAIGVYALCLSWRLPRRAAWIAAVLSGLGCGSLYTLYDPYTSDPLMYALSPLLLWLLINDRVAIAAALAAVGVLAKEFAAAPMLIFTAVTAASGRWLAALRVLAYAQIALIVWLILQLVLAVAFNYSFGGNPSAHLLQGAYLRQWLAANSVALSVMAIVGEFGMMWLLAPAGWRRAPSKLRRFAIASIPVALIFVYVQQPDRALWNFHFVVAPLAAMVLCEAPAWPRNLAIGAYVLANLRLGSQLSYVPSARLGLVISMLLSVVLLTYRQPPPGEREEVRAA